LHQAIFSDKERTMIKEYLKAGNQGEGFRVLKHRAKQYEFTIIGDFDLLLKLLLAIRTKSILCVEDKE